MMVDYGSIPSRIASLESEVIYLRHLANTTSDSTTKDLSEKLIGVLIKRLQSLKLIRQ